jgi:hypothetical protein
MLNLRPVSQRYVAHPQASLPQSSGSNPTQIRIYVPLKKDWTYYTYLHHFVAPKPSWINPQYLRHGGYF